MQAHENSFAVVGGVVDSTFVGTWWAFEPCVSRPSLRWRPCVCVCVTAVCGVCVCPSLTHSVGGVQRPRIVSAEPNAQFDRFVQL